MTRTGGIVVGRPSHERLEAMLVAARSSALTYDHVGSTLDDASTRPAHQQSLVLGSGPACFTSAVDGLRAWACHDGIGASVHPSDAPLVVDSTVLVVLPAGPFAIVVPNRIVVVVDEPDRFGFAYGTLEGHQERGEESFLVERRQDDTVVATITVDAAPATVAASLVAPVVRRLQHAAVRRYLRGLHDSVVTT